MQLSLDVGSCSAFSPTQRAALLATLGGKLAGTVLTIHAAEHRSQRRNRVAARERLAALVSEALVPQRTRRASKPTRASQRRRVDAKMRRGEVKQGRRRPTSD